MNPKLFDEAASKAGEAGKPSESWLADFKKLFFLTHVLRNQLCRICKAPEGLHGSNPANNPLRPDTGAHCEEFRPQK